MKPFSCLDYKNCKYYNKEKWHERYIKYMQTKAALTKTEAEDTLNAGMGEYDYNDVPEDAADEELSYWINDA